MIKTVIFDMDGVIVDTEPLHSNAFHQHFKNLDLKVAPEMYASLLGKSTKNVYQTLKENFDLQHDIPFLMEQKRQLFFETFNKDIQLSLIDGVQQLIYDLYDNGVQLILASSSSKKTIHAVFERFNLYPYFTDLVSGEDFPKSKPDPAIFEFAASLSKSPKENCLVIEDSSNGVIAAKLAGLYCIGYESVHSKEQDLSMADVVIEDFNALDYNKIKFIND